MQHSEKLSGDIVQWQLVLPCFQDGCVHLFWGKASLGVSEGPQEDQHCPHMVRAPVTATQHHWQTEEEGHSSARAQQELWDLVTQPTGSLDFCQELWIHNLQGHTALSPISCYWGWDFTVRHCHGSWFPVPFNSELSKSSLLSAFPAEHSARILLISFYSQHWSYCPIEAIVLFRRKCPMSETWETLENFNWTENLFAKL